MRLTGQYCDLEADHYGLWIYGSGETYFDSCKRHYHWGRKHKGTKVFHECRLYGFDIAVAAHGLLNARSAAQRFIREMNR